ncbi:YciI family protein [Modestobacter versicolor]|uniref:YciI family protein n=1 Tax=Modestobacter versicolor TaxID=429133 RepID=UPI0034DE93BE
MTQYLLSVVTPAEGGEPPTPDELTAIMSRVEAVQTRVRQAGAWVFAGGLAAPSSATVLRPKGDEVLLVDGPFAEGKEYLGGLSVIDVADLDEALRWGREFVAAIGLPIEVRPFEW